MITDWIQYEDFLEARYPQRLQKLYTKPETRQAYAALRDTMPAGKARHSMRVGQTLAKSGVRQKDVVDAALFHDYLERGGDIRSAARTLGFSDRTIRLINILSNDEKFENPYVGNGPLMHLQQVLGDAALDGETRNYVILIKIADRIDNLNRRLDAGGLSQGYARKSKELLTWLFQEYHGNPAEAMFLRNRLKNFGIKIKKKHLLAIPDSAATRPALPTPPAPPPQDRPDFVAGPYRPTHFPSFFS